MEIKMDYYVKIKGTPGTGYLEHITLTDEDIIDIAMQKYVEKHNSVEDYEIEAEIDKIII